MKRRSTNQVKQVYTLNEFNSEKLLEVVYKLNPLEPDLLNKIPAILKNEFGFSQVQLDTVTDREPLNLNPSGIWEAEDGLTESVLLRNEQTKIIGLLTVCLEKKDSLKDKELISEIGKIVEKALQINRNCYQMKANVKILEKILYKLPAALILCDSNFSLIHMNEEADRILKVLKGELSRKEAEDFVRSQLLSVYMDTGKNEFSIAAGAGNLQVSIRSHILHDVSKDAFSSCYQITMKWTGKMNETKWNEFLKSKKLTRRECEVSNLMRLGYTNEEIASKLYISINTMKRHRESIYKKLEINRINQLNIMYEKFMKNE